MRLDGFELRVRPGSGVAARFGDVAVFVAHGGPEDPDVETLLDTCRALGVVPGPFPGDQIVGRLRDGALLGSGSPLAFAVVAPLIGGLELVAQGPVEVAIDRGGAVTRHQGHEPGSWIDLVVDDGFDSLVMSPRGSVGERPAPPFEGAGAELGDDLVSAGALVLARTEDGAMPPGPMAAGDGAGNGRRGDASDGGWDDLVRAVLDDEAAARVARARNQEGRAAAIEAVVLVGPPPRPDRVPLPVGAPPLAPPGPRVAALRCPAGHASPPSASWCVQCGRVLSGPGVTRVEAVRPCLGLLVVDDGSVFALDTGYVLGTEPESSSAVAHGTMRPLRVHGDAGQVGAAHAEIRLAGWELLVVDRGTPSGTEVRPPGAHRPHRLEPELPEPLSPGSAVIVGSTTFLFVARPTRAPRLP